MGKTDRERFTISTNIILTISLITRVINLKVYTAFSMTYWFLSEVHRPDDTNSLRLCLESES